MKNLIVILVFTFVFHSVTFCQNKPYLYLINQYATQQKADTVIVINKTEYSLPDSTGKIKIFSLNDFKDDKRTIFGIKIFPVKFISDTLIFEYKPFSSRNADGQRWHTLGEPKLYYAVYSKKQKAYIFVKHD